jgi:pyrroline-5-carboxylate reductase
MGMKLGVIGCGKMGGALLEGIVHSGVCEGSNVILFDSYLPAAEALAEKLTGKVVSSNAEVVELADVILICVKPQGIIEMLDGIGKSENKLLISIVAGVKSRAIEKAVQDRHRVIRVMPNTPAMVGKGAAGIAKGSRATNEDAVLALKLFESVGVAYEVQESDLDAVTALSGSGPAYVFLLIEALVAASVEQGIDEETALRLATQTVAGAAEMVSRTGEAPSILRENVTSPNGTTFAALESFREDGFTVMVKKALDAARDRSIELGK